MKQLLPLSFALVALVGCSHTETTTTKPGETKKITGGGADLTMTAKSGSYAANMLSPGSLANASTSRLGQ